MNNTDGMTLVEFLRARLDEDEQTARKCRPQQWVADGTDVRSPRVSTRAGYAEFGLHDHVARLSLTAGKFEVERDNAAHIARWDPARVLAEVAAKRAILAEVERILPISTDPMTPAGVVVIAMTQPYADHPDYDEAWRP